MIKKLFEKLCCMHKWKVHQSVKLHFHEDDGGGLKTVRETLFCKCGKIKQITL